MKKKTDGSRLLLEFSNKAGDGNYTHCVDHYIMHRIIYSLSLFTTDTPEADETLST